MANRQNLAVKVLVVDDSAFMRKVISDILTSDEGIEVIDTARDGKEALAKVKELKPDVVTLDVEMPVMDGLSCLREMLRTEQVSVIMLSSLTVEGAKATLQALEDGAIDFITKPSNIFDIKGEEKQHELIEKVKMAKSIRKPRKESSRTASGGTAVRQADSSFQAINGRYIVAIGTSTGGPKALQSVIPLIPGNVPAAFLVVQHMPPGFTKSLADRLNGMSEVTVKEAEDGETVKDGYVYVAPGDYHMLVEKSEGSLKIRLSQSPPAGGHRPAVNVMMESLSNTGLKNIIGVIMTGMGGDGSEGIKLLKTINQAYNIAQDEKTCVVYGMPKVAVQTGAVDAVVPLHEITGQIMKIVGVQK
jgi:two-component system, chemotaxis family, protein-glutamate methylesterase/glutaminase